MASSRPMVPAPATGSRMACRVLIADDYMDAAESLALLLAADSNFETEVALDGQAALDCANEWHPHICVLDLDMPKVDGLKLARQIREQNWSERPLLIALSGWTSVRDRTGALEAGSITTSTSQWSLR
jgi:DNA-binding response OmpR family regulator